MKRLSSIGRMQQQPPPTPTPTPTPFASFLTCNSTHAHFLPPPLSFTLPPGENTSIDLSHFAESSRCLTLHTLRFYASVSAAAGFLISRERPETSAKTTHRLMQQLVCTYIMRTLFGTAAQCAISRTTKNYILRCCFSLKLYVIYPMRSMHAWVHASMDTCIT